MYVSLWKRAALCLACFGMIVPQGTLAAAEKKAQQPTVRMLDLKLTEGGKLTGQVVNAQGQVLRNAIVAVRYQDHVVAKATTDTSGRYAIQGLRAGVHELETANGRIPARFWTATAAPQIAESSALIVSDTNVIRAQCAEPGCTANPSGPGPVGCGNGCGGGWVAGTHCGRRAGGGGLLHGGLFRGGLFQQQDPCDPCAQNDDHGNLLVCGLVVAGIATAIAIAADDDDDNNASP